MRQKRNAILSELLDRIAFLGLAATSRSTAIKDDGVITLAEHRHNPNVPGRRRPPRRRHEQDRFALSFLLEIKTDIAYVSRRHLTFMNGSMFKVQCERDRPFSLSFEPETVNFRVLARDGLASQAPMRNSSTRSNWMPDQEILQRGKPTGAIPKGHMLYVRNQKHFAAGRQLGQTLRGSHRCATAPAHIIVSATENERRNCYLGSLRESVPSKTRILVTAKDFHRALSRPDGIGQGHHHVAMFAIKLRVKCHGIVFDVGANVTLEPHVANFSFGIS